MVVLQNPLKIIVGSKVSFPPRIELNQITRLTEWSTVDVATGGGLGGGGGGGVAYKEKVSYEASVKKSKIFQ